MLPAGKLDQKPVQPTGSTSPSCSSPAVPGNGGELQGGIETGAGRNTPRYSPCRTPSQSPLSCHSSGP